MFNEEKRSIGRPRLADTRQKKTALIISAIMLVITIVLFLGGLFSLNILPNIWKIRGSVPIYKSYEMGDEFCLGTECFIVINDTDDEVLALASKNVDTNLNRQSDNANNITFSDETYWYDSDNNKLKEEYGSDYPVNVLDENSNLWTPLKNYESYLKNDIGKKSIKASLLNVYNIYNVGCSLNNNGSSVSCATTVTVYFGNTNFWTEIAYEDKILKMRKNSTPSYITDDNYEAGLRPVITIKKEEFAEIVDYEKPVQEDKREEENKYYPGDEFCIDTECFYTLYEENGIITAISKYSLYYGKVFKLENDVLIETEITEEDSGYNLQRSIAGKYLETSISGLVSFANKKTDVSYGYWWDNENRKVSSEYKAENGYYIYDSNSNLYKPLEYYKNYLSNKINNKSIDIGLLSVTDFIVHICDTGSNECQNFDWSILFGYNRDNSYTYWTGSPDVSHGANVYAVINDSFNPILFSSDSSIRPVIKISKNDIPKNRGLSTKQYSYGREVCINTECFNVLTDNGDTVTMLPKYNLLVGDELKINLFNESDREIIPIDKNISGYGLQSKKSKGIYSMFDTNLDATLTGVIPFNTNYSEEEMYGNGYWIDSTTGEIKEKYKSSKYTINNSDVYYIYDDNSTLYNISEKYKDYLNTFLKNKSATQSLMNINQMYKLLCRGIEYCGDSDFVYPNWYTKTSFWTGISATSNGAIIVGAGDDYLTMLPVNSPISYAGLRPVITVNKSDLEKSSSVDILPINNSGDNQKIDSNKLKNVKKIIDNNTKLKKEETTTTEKKIINKITKKAKEKVEEIKAKKKKKNILTIILGVLATILVAGIGFITYKRNKY